jgi:hypothetical protein
MIYRVTAKFFDTEDAQRAARRISGITGDVYEVRLNYRGEYEGGELVYGGKNREVLYSDYGARIPLADISSGLKSLPYYEQSEECYMSVFCKDEINTVVSEAIINCGGYDIEIKEEKLL